MSEQINPPVRALSPAAVRTNKLIRNTYLLLSASLLFSAVTAGVSMLLDLPYINGLLLLGVYFALLYAITTTRNSAWGLVWLFALTGFMGLTLGTIIDVYLHIFSNGAQIVATALGGTGAIFLGLSGYALTTRKNFSFIGGFLMVGVLVAFLASIAALVFSIPGLSLAVSAAFILLMSGMILFETSRLVHDPHANYILVTLGLYIAIYNLFVSLLHILAVFAGNRD